MGRTTKFRELKNAFDKSLFQEFARLIGFEGRVGGWIYDGAGEAVAHGWFCLYLDNYSMRLRYRDWLAEKAEGLSSFSDIVTDNVYRPTIRPRSAYHKALADEYDAVMKKKGDSRRAFRGQ